MKRASLGRKPIPHVASTHTGFGVLVVHPPFPAKTLPEFIAYTKTNPGKINMASGGAGSAQHVYGELFKAMAGVNMQHVPYRGGGPALTDLLAGQVPVMFDTLATSIEHIRAGKLLALAVTSATRSNVLPNIPAVAEVVPGYEASGWQGIGVPRSTPVEVIDKLHKAVCGLSPDIHRKMGQGDPRCQHQGGIGCHRRADIP